MGSLGINILNRFPAFASKNFRYFWSSHCISFTGTWMQRTAQQWLVYKLTSSALFLALLAAFQFGPILVFSLFAGVYIDQFPKKKIIIVTNTVLMLQSMVLAYLVFTDRIEYWHIIFLAAIMGFANTFDMPARHSFVSELVSKQNLPNAVGLNSMMSNLARIVGPALAGIVISYLGISMTFFLNTLSFIPVIYALNKIDVQSIVRTKNSPKILGEIKAGVRYIRNTPVLTRSLFIMLIVSTLALNFEVILPVFTIEVLSRDSSTYSILLSCLGVGALFGASTTALRNQSPNETYIYRCACTIAAITIVATFIKNYHLIMLTMTMFGYFTVLLTTTTTSSLHLNSQAEFRGRVMSIYTLAIVGTTPIGNFIAGIITHYWGPNFGFGICGVALLVMLFKLRK